MVLSLWNIEHVLAHLWLRPDGPFNMQHQELIVQILPPDDAVFIWGIDHILLSFHLSFLFVGIIHLGKSRGTQGLLFLQMLCAMKFYLILRGCLLHQQ